MRHKSIFMTGDSLLVIGLCAALSLLLLAVSLRLRRQQRLLHDLPTSRASGVFIGLVELKGTAECAAPLRGFLSETSCVGYDFRIEEQWSRTVTESYTDKDGKTQTRTRQESGWTTVAADAALTDFYVKDDTGAVLVRPTGAKLEPVLLFDRTVSRGDPLYYAKGPAGAVSDSDHRRRFSERGVPLHAPLFIVGQARERADVVAPEIAADPEAPLFLISTRPEEKVQRGYSIGSWVWWAIGLLLAGGGTLPWARGLAPDRQGVPVAAAIAVYLALWQLGWVWMVFNSLVSLRARVRRGWSLVEVELKRRHDLIPGLAAAVAGLNAHEREVQTALAAMRAQQAATPPGVAGPDFDGLAGQFRGVLEKYPALVAQEGFSRLHGELVRTEQRIALARTYYNDIATHFATRLERVPDRWIARVGAMKPEPLLQAAEFERAPVHVDFAA